MNWPLFDEESDDVMYTDDPPNLNFDSEEDCVLLVVDCSSSMNDLSGKKSRMSIIKDGLTAELTKLKSTSPNAKIGIVSFEEDVIIHKDGLSEPILIDDVHTKKWGNLINEGQLDFTLAPLKDSFDNLVKVIDSLVANGTTALGPALVVAATMAEYNSKTTSKIVVCTDGLANTGLGYFNRNGTVPEKSDQFYRSLIEYCKLKGITLNLLAFDDCGVATIVGSLSTETGGLLYRILAEEASVKLRKAFTNKTIARNAKISFIVHKNMYVENSDNKYRKKSRHTQKIGNINDSMVKSFLLALKISSKKLLKIQQK